MTPWTGDSAACLALDRSSPVPLYAQLDHILRSQIRSGQWAEGMMVPSENTLAKQLGISRMTARGVLKSLADDGLVTRIPGKGTFVSSSKIETPAPAFQGVRAQLEAQGWATTTRLLTLHLTHPSGTVAGHLEINSAQDVYFVERLRCVEGTPISLHQSWIPRGLAPDLDTKNVITEQLCHILANNYALYARRIEQTLESTSAHRETAQRLGLTTSAPLLLLQEKSLDENGTPFEYSRVFFRGDRIRLSFRFTDQG